MSHGENFREISHEKETHKQFHKVFHVVVHPLSHPFFFLSQKLDGRGQASKYFILLLEAEQNRV